MLRNYFCIVFAGIWSVLGFLFAILMGIVRFNSDAGIWVMREFWARGLLWAGGAKLEVQGQENVDAKRPTIYVCNHQSTIDICAIAVALPVPFRWVGKLELAYVPFIGWYLYLAGHIFVNRGNQASAIRSLDRAGERIRGGTSIVLYPEGTRSDGGILPFKKGPFALALKARVPIVPVTIEGSGRLMPKNRWVITPGPIRVKIGKPMDTTSFAADDRVGLAKAVRDVIIQQSLELGGVGGDRDAVVAAAGREGVVQ